MTELEIPKLRAALPPLPEEVRATVVLIWSEVISGHVDLSRLHELCLESLAQPEWDRADAMMLNLIDELIAHPMPVWASLAAFSAGPDGADRKRIPVCCADPFAPACHVIWDVSLREVHGAASQRSN